MPEGDAKDGYLKWWLTGFLSAGMLRDDVILAQERDDDPAIRAKITASGEPASVLAARYSVTLNTIYRWRGRTSF